MDTSEKKRERKILIAGPCVINNYHESSIIAQYLYDVSKEYEFDLIFKGSYKKANRTSASSFTGMDPIESLEILRCISGEYEIPVITDVHESPDVNIVSKYVTHLQIPAFL